MTRRATLSGGLRGGPPVPPNDGTAVTSWSWLLTVDLGVLVWHWTAERIEVDGLPGHLVGSSLNVETSREGLEADEGGLGLELQLPAGRPLPFLRMAGGDLEGAHVELALVPCIAGARAWSRRRVVVTGTAEDVSWGDEQEPVAFSVRARDLDQLRGRRWPPAAWVVTDENQVYDVPKNAIGEVYPVVYGAPGIGRNGLYPASPAILVSDVLDGDVVLSDVLLLCVGSVATDSVRILAPRANGKTIDPAVDIAYTRDRTGLDIAAVSLDMQPNFIRQATNFSANWSEGSALVPAGKAWFPTAWSRDLRGWPLVDLVTHVAGVTGTPVDARRMQDAAGSLWSLELDTYLDEPTTLASWLDELLEHLPVRAAVSELGLYLLPVRWQALRSRPRGHIIIGERGVWSTRPVRDVGSRNARVTEVRARCGRDILQGRYTADVGAAVAGGRVVPTANRWGAQVQALQAEHELLVELPHVWRMSVAYQVAAYVAWRDLVPHHLVEVEVDAATYGWMRAGEIVRVTWPDVRWSWRPAMVVEVELSDAPARRMVLRVE